MNDTSMIDTMIKDGLTDAFHNLHMGNTGILKLKIIKDKLVFTNVILNSWRSSKGF